MGKISDAWVTDRLRPIGPESQLQGAVYAQQGGQTFFTVRGPCGEGHTMNVEEARKLLKWLQDNLPGTNEDDPEWRLRMLRDEQEGCAS